MEYKRKKTIPTYPSTVLSGKIILLDDKKNIVWNAPKILQWFLQEHTKIGDDISAKFICKRPKRSNEQNNFFHLYLSLISLSSGHTMEELKAWYKGKFLSKGITEVFGHQTRIVKSSADLNISEFCELMNQIEEATTIPIPNPESFNIPLFLDEYNKLKEKQKETYSKLKAKL